MLPHQMFFIALDGMTRAKAFGFVKKFTQSRHAGWVAGFKIHDLWDRYGPAIIRDLKRHGAEVVWLDLKLHDTPKTIALRAQAAKQAGADIVSVHAGSGIRGLRAARRSGLRVVVITALTSLGHREIKNIYGTSGVSAVRRLSALARHARAWGVVCSAQELPEAKKFRGMRIIVPGIRTHGEKNGNQKRTATGPEALRAGADFLVLGSTVTDTRNPLAALENVIMTLKRDQKTPDR